MIDKKRVNETGDTQVIDRFVPNQYFPSVFDISITQLKEKGITSIIIDLDNTLIGWDMDEATAELKNWFDLLHKEGFSITIVSNNSRHRVRTFADPLGISYIARAKKPLGGSFEKAASLMDAATEDTAVIGDQLLTDILGGNRRGFHTILVAPVKQSDGAATKFNRFMERKVFKAMKRKGLMEWKENEKTK